MKDGESGIRRHGSGIVILTSGLFWIIVVIWMSDPKLL